jgi:SAM-dependent methyltransferase
MAAFDTHTPREIRTMLELGSGGGNNASHMKQRYELTLTDLSPQMLEQSKKINPGCEHIEGDMRTLRLGRTFDAVFVHDAVAYMTTEADLEKAMRTAYVHLELPGIALFVPDGTKESYHRSSSEGGHDAGGRSLHYLEWDSDIEPGATSYRSHFRIVMTENGEERTVTDEHVIGLFPRATWIRLLESVGFEARIVPFLHSDFPPDAGHEIFVAVRR